MPGWNYQPYQGINPQLLQMMAQQPSKNAMNLNALMQGLGPGLQQGSNNMIQAMIQKNMINRLMQQMSQGQDAYSQGAFGGQNPLMQSINQQTTMGYDPLGLGLGQ